MTAVDASRPLRKDAARNRAALVAAAREVFGERGFEATLDDVAHRAGVGVGTAYRHFANKYELAQAVFGEAVGEVVAITAAAAEQDNPWDGIVAFLEATATAQTADRGLREVLMGQHDSGHVEHANNLIVPPLRRLLERAKAAGAVRADAGVSDLGMVVMMLCTVADLSADYDPELWRRYMPIMLDGLRPGVPLPMTALPEDDMRVAMASHKQRISRATGGRDHSSGQSSSL